MMVGVVAGVLAIVTALVAHHTGASPATEPVVVDQYDAVKSDISYHTCLELVADHVTGVRDLVTIGRSWKPGYAQVQTRIRLVLETYLSDLLFDMRTPVDMLPSQLNTAVQLCRQRSDRDVILQRIFTDANTMTFLMRLPLLIGLDAADLVLDLFAMIGWIESVADLTTGWIAVTRAWVAHSNGFSTSCLELFDSVTDGILARLTRLAPITQDEFPEPIWTTILTHLGRDAGRSSAFDWYADLFLKIEPSRCLEISADIAERHADLIWARPDLTRRLYSLGLGLDLRCLPWTEYTATDLETMLPYLTNTVTAFAHQINTLFELERDDLIDVFLRYFALLHHSPEFNAELMERLFTSAVLWGRYDVLRRVLTQPYIADWVADFERCKQMDLLTLAVQLLSLDAMRFLLDDVPWALACAHAPNAELCAQFLDRIYLNSAPDLISVDDP